MGRPRAMMLNETHDPALRSWVESANAPEADFPLQNLPFAAFRRTDGAGLRLGVAIGDAIVDLSHPAVAALLEAAVAQACRGPALNELMALGPAAWSGLRLALSRALRAGSAQQTGLRAALVPQSGVQFGLPARIGDFTDFYTSIHHASAVGRLLRPDQPLLPNYKWIPVAYHGRASSVRVSGGTVARPIGQIRPPGADAPAVEATRRLDYEVEVGVFIGAGNPLERPIPIGRAWQHVFGVVLLNDWSARDIQAWEYQPLGPFLSKSFATTISPWVVSAEALVPYGSPLVRPGDDPQPLPYLDDPTDRAGGCLDIVLEAWIETDAMRATRQPAALLSRSSSRHAYWTVAQMVAHHTVNGCNLVAGDLLGTGTQSGPGPAEAGSLIELSAGGREPLTLPNGERRAFLEDGDEVRLRGYCEREGFVRIGLGTAVGRIAAPRGR
jgi:fumarylacetoacetase